MRRTQYLQHERILKVLDVMCDAIAGGLPEHFEVPMEAEPSQQESQAIMAVDVSC